MGLGWGWARGQDLGGDGGRWEFVDLARGKVWKRLEDNGFGFGGRPVGLGGLNSENGVSGVYCLIIIR